MISQIRKRNVQTIDIILQNIFFENNETETRNLENDFKQKQICEGMMAEKELFSDTKINQKVTNYLVTMILLNNCISIFSNKASFQIIFINRELSIFLKQDLNTLFQTKDMDKRIIKNWSTVSFLNRDMKLVNKALATGSKKVLPSFFILIGYEDLLAKV